MAHIICEILEIGLASNERVIRLSCPPGMIPATGQYMSAAGLGTNEILPTQLFLSEVKTDYVEFCGDLPAGWSPGIKIDLRGPFGKGFHLPAKARWVAAATFIEHSLRIIPVIRLAISQGAGVSLFSAHLIEDLPAEVEVLPIDQMSEAWSWADYVIIEARLEQIPQLRNLIGLAEGSHPACLAEVFILTPMPCVGMAECGVCAVSSSRRYHLICKEGPVFPLNSLIEQI